MCVFPPTNNSQIKAVWLHTGTQLAWNRQMKGSSVSIWPLNELLKNKKIIILSNHLHSGCKNRTIIKNIVILTGESRQQWNRKNKNSVLGVFVSCTKQWCTKDEMAGEDSRDHMRKRGRELRTEQSGGEGSERAGREGLLQHCLIHPFFSHSFPSAKFPSLILVPLFVNSFCAVCFFLPRNIKTLTFSHFLCLCSKKISQICAVYVKTNSDSQWQLREPGHWAEKPWLHPDWLLFALGQDCWV